MTVEIGHVETIFRYLRRGHSHRSTGGRTDHTAPCGDREVVGGVVTAFSCHFRSDRRSPPPDRASVYRDCGHSLRIEQHPVTTSGRKLIRWEHLANSHEHELSLFRSDELHPAESDASVTAGVIGEDDLVRRQRHPEAVGEEHECAWWAVPNNRKRRDPVALPEDRRGRREVDEQRNVVHWG